MSECIYFKNVLFKTVTENWCLIYIFPTKWFYSFHFNSIVFIILED